MSGYYFVLDREMFDEGVCIKFKYDEELHCELQGLCRFPYQEKIDKDIPSTPCIYKKILSYKNGFARAINIAGNLVYISNTKDPIYDHEFPFVPELCEDFDKEGYAKIACLVDGVFILKGYMNKDGEMFFNNYNS